MITSALQNVSQTGELYKAEIKQLWTLPDLKPQQKYGIEQDGRVFCSSYFDFCYM